MTRMALAFLAATACAGRTPAPAPTCEPVAVRTEAARWLRLAELRGTELYDAAPLIARRPLVPPPGTRPLVVDSFAGLPAGHPLRGRSFLYDDALALLWYTQLGDETAARGLAAALVALQNDDGSWGFRVSIDDGFYNASYVRMGTVAWVAHALTTYIRRFRDPPAEAAAVHAARALMRARRTTGLLEGGRGRWSADERSFDPEFRLRAAITEHQLDAQVALAALAPEAAALLGKQILAGLWLEQEGRFAVAADDDGPHPGRALDAAGGWGALWLAAQGDLDRASRSLGYTVQAFTASGQEGFRPYLDPVEGPESALEPDLVFVEGTLGVGLAAHRLGQRAVAEQALRTAVALACAHGPGIPYANREAHGFIAAPAAASTLWFLFLEREMRTGERAPVFPNMTGSKGSP
jgi:hypothetical protein